MLKKAFVGVPQQNHPEAPPLYAGDSIKSEI